jgi:hypothetical protein
MQVCGQKQQPKADCSDQQCWWLWCHGASAYRQYIPATQLENTLTIKLFDSKEGHINQKSVKLKELEKLFNPIPGRHSQGIFSFCHHIQIFPGAHTASYPIGTGDSFFGSKADEAQG